jgi:hypothetical protein
MLRIKRVLLAAFMGALAAAAFAGPAQAATADFKCAVLGSAKTRDKLDPTIGVRLIGGSGTYTFTQIALNCVGTEKGQAAAWHATIVSTGKYENIVCGSGTAWSLAGSTSITAGTFAYDVAPAAPKGVAYYNTQVAGLVYKVLFNGSAGTFHTNNATSANPAKNVAKPTNLEQRNDEKTGSAPPTGLKLAGAVQLAAPLPTEKTGTPNALAGECTKAFHVTGTIDLVR